MERKSLREKSYSESIINTNLGGEKKKITCAQREKGKSTERVEGR